MENRDDESDKKKEIADDVEEQFPYNVYLPERGYLTYPDNSLLCLGVNNRFRFMMIWVNEWPWFDRFVLFLIVLNSLFLAFNDFEFRTPSGETSWRNDLVDDSEIIFQILFTIECVIKITAMGFVTEQGTYIRDPWNVLDFLVVIIGWVGLLPGVANLTALRAIRVLRPLRSVKKIEKMRVLVASLMKSIPALANVVIFLFFILLVFSIIGVYFFRGLNYQRCRYTDEPVSGEDWIADPNIVRLCSLDADFQIFQCPEDRYCGLPGDYFMFDYIYYAESKIEELDYGLTTFDNVASASYSILQIITLEGWTKMMYNYYDCWNPWFVSLYFTIVVIMGAFFLLNLLLAAIYMNFGKVKASILAEKEESQRIEQERQETLGSAHNVVVSAAISQADLENLDDDDTSQQLSKQKTSDKQVKRAKSSKSSKSNSQSSQHSSSSMVIASNENRQGNFGNNEDLVGVGDMSSSAHLEQPDCRPNTMSHMKNSRSLEEQSNGFQISSANDELLDETTEDQSKLVIVYPLGFRNSLQILVENKWFNNFITLCIILNVVFLALDRYPMDKEEQFTVEMANLVFYVIFALEMILKLYALGIRGYSSDRFNVFDGIIVILSTLELVLTYAAAGLGTGGVISAFRALRLLRVFKLAKNWPDFQDLIATMTKTLADISYFGILMFLFIFIFSLLGMEFFAHKVKLDEDNQPDRHGDSPRENFDDFFHAFVTIFVILVGDDWQFVYYHSSRTVGPASLVYFLALAIMGNFILLNLFLAILLGNFEKGQTDEGREAAKEKQEKAKRDAEEEEKYEKELDRIGSQVKRSSTVGLSGKALWIFDRSGFVRKT